MTVPDKPANSQRRAEERPSDDRRRDGPGRRPDPGHADAVQGERTTTRFVDPYDTRAEPQPEEPGYGHGV